MSAEPIAPASHNVSFREAVRVWTRIGLLSFGGPAGQIALMHRELVEERRWISEARFLHALNYCMLLPGPEAQQLAIYIGWLMHRTRGGIIAGTLFIAPGAFVIFALSTLYARFQQLPLVGALFFGLKAAVLAIVVEAVLRIARRALKSAFLIALAAGAFLAIFALAIPFPWIVLGAGVLGMLAHRANPRWLQTQQKAVAAGQADSIIDRLFESGQLEHAQPNTARSLRVILVTTGLWAAPIALLAVWQGVQSVYVREGIFFSQTAVVTFGGAYSVLSYVAQRAVEDFAWLRPGEMIDGLALAETTPGPLILVLQFVAYLGAYRSPGSLGPSTSGLLGSLVALWATFVPCFLWIFLGAPYVEKLSLLSILNAALTSITAAVVGVILNLSVWFALHTLFAEVHPWRAGILHLNVPVASTLNVAALALTAIALVAMLRFKVSMLITLTGCAALGLAAHGLLR
jgi:chromate transporter